jgi:hypothetical protein
VWAQLLQITGPSEHDFDIISKYDHFADGAIGLMALIIFVFVHDLQASFWVIQALFAVCASVIGRWIANSLHEI